jgi:hypothetical protein
VSPPGPQDERDPFAPPDDDGAEVEVEGVQRRTRSAATARQVESAPLRDVPVLVQAPPTANVPAAVALVLAPLAVLLPARWRRHFSLDELPLAVGAALNPLVVGPLAVWAFAEQLLRLRSQVLEPVAPAMAAHLAQGGETAGLAVVGSGVTLWLSALLTPVGAYATYSAAEAMVRLAGVGATGEIVPHGPLAALDRIGLSLLRRIRDLRLGPLVADEAEVTRGGSTLTIASCRARPWPKGFVLVAFDAGWTAVAHEVRKNGPRRFVYRFERAPEGQIVRGGTVYRPDELVARRAAEVSWWRAVRSGLGGQRRR